MFLAQLAYKTVEKKIEELDAKTCNRADALKKSNQELEQDQLDLMVFIQ